MLPLQNAAGELRGHGLAIILLVLIVFMQAGHYEDLLALSGGGRAAGENHQTEVKTFPGERKLRLVVEHCKNVMPGAWGNQYDDLEAKRGLSKIYIPPASALADMEQLLPTFAAKTPNWRSC